VTQTARAIRARSRGAQPELASGERALRYAALVFLAGFVLHNADHFRRGLEVLTPAVFWAGTLSGIISLAAIALTLRGHRLAPWIAVAIGFGMAFGVSMVHLLPRWSALSDSLPDGHVDPVTWVAVLCEIAGALIFGWVGLRHLPRAERQQRLS